MHHPDPDTLRAPDAARPSLTGRAWAWAARLVRGGREPAIVLARRRAKRLRALLDGRTDLLRQALARSELAGKAKNEFLAKITHEIRTPMTSILGYADLMRDAALSPQDREHHYQTIRRNGEHLLAILNDLLDLSKIEAGAMSVESLDVSPVQILHDAVEAARPAATAKSLSLSVEHRWPLPAAARSDPVRVRQILFNLLSNAVKFTPEGSVHVVCEQRGDGTGRPCVAFEVHDTGIGISQSQAKRLFRPFGQADDSTTRLYGGTGLGLALSRQLALALGGDLRLVSQPGQGSTFTFLLPIGEPAERGEAFALSDCLSPPQARRAAAPAQPLKGRILLVEDSPDNQRLLGFYLRKAGAVVEVADNGTEGVKRALWAGRGRRAADEGPFDLVLMDLQMPGLDGLAAMVQMRKGGYQGPIIALTAHTVHGEKDRCLRAGFDDFLSKPVEREKLVEACRHWIARRGSDAAITAA